MMTDRMGTSQGIGLKNRSFARFAVPAFGVRLLLTGHGVVYVVLLAALLVGSINHNNNLGYLLTFLLSAILLVSIIFTLRNINGFTCQGHGEAAVFAGQALPFSLSLQAKDGPCYGLALSLDGKSWVRVERVDALSVASQVLMPVNRRGRIEMRRIFAASAFPLGLLRATREISVILTGLVYPKPFPTHAGSEKIQGEREENDKLPLHTAGHDFDGLRHYRPGDPPRRIHWKSLAAQRGLFAKVFEEDEGGGAIFSLADMPGEIFEDKLGELCYLMLRADGNGARYGLRLGGQLIAPGRGLSHKSLCLRALALYQSS
ncbi:MAG: DUF58 domain-containing protein [Desulfobulbus sp.]|uniref:DUF58 domain-containing protein n=1 Tax=Desulfobulbus sp. TaxID=895 RepID=UPI00284E5668|nr:DUF58 domain-containing protein [Desulfobulbus sp.]MDR2551346.1 DUF58 domain-containing protein [Desulfobulbus sp.]